MDTVITINRVGTSPNPVYLSSLSLAKISARDFKYEHDR